VTTDAPRRVSDREVPIAITGYFMPTQAPDVGEEVGDPVLIGMPGTDDLFVFVFSTEEKLVAAMGSFGIEYERVARVIDGTDLIGEIAEMNARDGRPYRIRVAVDAYKKTDDGRVRFLEPLLQGAP
jgi:hypothetical protein